MAIRVPAAPGPSADAYDVVILCVGGCTAAEFEIYHQIRRIDPCVPVILLRAAEPTWRSRRPPFYFPVPLVEPAARAGLSPTLDIARGRGQSSDEATDENDLDIRPSSDPARPWAMSTRRLVAWRTRMSSC